MEFASDLSGSSGRESFFSDHQVGSAALVRAEQMKRRKTNRTEGITQISASLYHLAHHFVGEFVGALVGDLNGRDRFGMVDPTLGCKLLSILDVPSVNLLPNKSWIGLLFLRGLF